MKTRIIAPTHKEWTPHGYQLRAIDHLCSRGSAALFLDPGMGKTAVTLAAFTELQDAGIANRMLVIAPMRVCQLVWRQEAQKWTQFRHLKIVNLAGKSAEDRKRLLQSDADIYLINPESVAWLCKQFVLQRLPFDTLVIDELTKFKNSGAKRSKELQPHADKMARRWGLTGTPVPNGYEDLFGQMKIIDGGAALGKYVTHFRDRFFQPGRDGFSYVLRPGAAEAIEKAVEPYVFRAAADDYLDLPPLVIDRIELEMPKEVEQKYKQMKRDMVLHLEGQTITAANMAACYNKMQQFAGGAMYTSPPEYVEVHTLKLDALDDLLEELQGKPLLVAYGYEHELTRILERHPDTPYLGGGVSGKVAEQIEQDWNAGKIPLLLCHPASAGHGLNMQLGGASHICWFTQTWDYELYDQFIRRVHRQGNSAERIVMHKLIVKNSIDELTEIALEDKETTQDALLAALKSEFVKDDPNAKSAFATTVGANMRRLTSPGAEASQQQAPAAPKGWGAPKQAEPAPATAPAAAAPKGWGTAKFGQAAAPAAPQPAPAAAPVAPKGWGAPKQNIQSGVEDRVEPETQPANGLAHFSPEVQQQVAGENYVDPQWSQPVNEAPFEGGQPAQPVLQEPPAKEAKRTRRKKSEPEQIDLEEAIAAAPRSASAPSAGVSITFDVGSFIVGLMVSSANGGPGYSFEQAYDAAATVVEGLRGQ